MAETKFPGVYVEELPTKVRPIEGVPTSTAVFLGTGPRDIDPTLLTSFSDFLQAAGEDAPGFLPLAVRGFFDNGGQRCYVTLSTAPDPVAAGLDALATIQFSMLCCPDEHQFHEAAAQLVAWAERRKDIVCVLQSPPPPIPDESHSPPARSSYVAYYYPWVIVGGRDGVEVSMPPGGHVCGVYARVDVERGVHAAPADIVLHGVQRLTHDVDAAASDALASRGINVLRHVPGRGLVVSGARTTTVDRDLLYVNVRRLLLYIERSIGAGLQWAVFEPNGPALWANIVRTVQDFLLDLWQTGALAGAKPETAFFVHCDRTTMTQADLGSGRFIAIVGVAPLRAAEFVVLRVTGQSVQPPD
jgi:phage tail sheath protein FI